MQLPSGLRNATSLAFVHFHVLKRSTEATKELLDAEQVLVLHTGIWYVESEHIIQS